MWLSPLFPLKKCLVQEYSDLCLAFHKYTQLFFIVVIYWKWVILHSEEQELEVNILAVLRALDSTFKELL